MREAKYTSIYQIYKSHQIYKSGGLCKQYETFFHWTVHHFINLLLLLTTVSISGGLLCASEIKIKNKIYYNID